MAVSTVMTLASEAAMPGHWLVADLSSALVNALAWCILDAPGRCRAASVSIVSEDCFKVSVNCEGWSEDVLGRIRRSVPGEAAFALASAARDVRVTSRCSGRVLTHTVQVLGTSDPVACAKPRRQAGVDVVVSGLFHEQPARKRQTCAHLPTVTAISSSVFGMSDDVLCPPTSEGHTVHTPIFSRSIWTQVLTGRLQRAKFLGFACCVFTTHIIPPGM
jgi:hypothetical protein